MNASEALSIVKSIAGADHAAAILQMNPEIIDVFTVLSDLGVTFPDDRDLYYTVVHIGPFTKPILEALQALKALNLEGAQKELCEDVMLGFFHADKLPAALNTLAHFGPELRNQQELLGKITKQMPELEKLTAAFNVLKTLNAELPAHSDIYLELADQLHAANEIAAVFTALSALGATLQNHSDLFRATLRKAHTIKLIQSAITTLNNFGLTIAEHQDLYLAAIENAEINNNLAYDLKTFKAQGVNLPEHKAFYLALWITTARNKLIEAFRVVTTHNVPPSLYSSIIDRLHYVNQLPQTFAVLTTFGASIQDHPELFRAAIKNMPQASLFPAALQKLSAKGLTLASNSRLFVEALNHASHESKFEQVCKVLTEQGITLPEYEALYVAAIRNAMNADLFPAILTKLKASGATLPEHVDLYLAVIRSPSFDTIPEAFKALQALPGTAAQKKGLYSLIVENPHSIDVVQTFVQLGLTMADDAELITLLTQKYQEYNLLKLAEFTKISAYKLPIEQIRILCELLLTNTDAPDFIPRLLGLEFLDFRVPADRAFYDAAIVKPDLSLFVLGKLQQLGIKRQSHPHLVDLFFFNDNKPFKHSHAINIQLLTYLKDFTTKTPLLKPEEPGFAAQYQALQQNLQNIINQDSKITQGPLNKSPEGIELERILQKIVKTTPDKIHMQYDKTNGYILTLPNEPPIYINHLLHHVNFNHIELSKRMIAQLGNIVQTISSSFNTITSSAETNAIKDLPPAVKWAIHNYLGDHRYKNINRLFRGLPQTAEIKYAWINPVSGTKNILVNFICGCLINWAAKELPLITLNKLKGQIPQNDIDLLDRGETLDGTEELGTMQSRLANPVFAPSVVSVSAHKTGSPHFQNAGTTRTKFEEFNNIRPVVYPAEGEQLIPHGTTFLYSKNPDGGFFAQEVNSPGIVPTGTYWGAVALSHAAKTRLSKQYADQPSQTTVNGVVIVRPNHGLAHTFRVMSYLPLVIDYFATHAQDPAFRLFCQFISLRELEWLSVAAAYRVTGRESEISAIENLGRYNEYKQASQNQFAAFLKVHPPKQADDAMQDRMASVVQHLGNPAYEAVLRAKQATPLAPQEQKHRLFLHHILSVAHNLDLPRCYSPDQVNNALTSCRALANTSPEQAADYQRMVTYAIDLNKAHGNALHTDITADGKLIPCYQPYSAPFERVSTNIRDLQAMTDTVPRPNLKEKYQFNQEDDPELVERIQAMCNGQSQSSDLKPT